MHIKYLTHLPNMMGIFVSCTYLEITIEAEVTVGYVLVSVFKIVGSVCLFSMLAK